MNTVEDAVRQTLVAHEVTDYDATDLLARVRADIESPDQRGQSAKPARLMIGAVTAVLVLLGAGWWTWSRDAASSQTPPPAGQSPSTRSTTTHESLAAPPGARLVGYQGLMLTLPGNWATAGSCGHRAHRLLTFPTTGSVDSCPYFRRHFPAAVVSFHDSIVGPPALLGKTVPGGNIGGEQVLLTDVIHRGSTYEQTLAVPPEQFYVAVLAQRRAVVNRIIESARAVPAGYASVPSVVGSPQGLAVRRLTAAGLSMRRPEQPQALCCPVRVTQQFPAAGMVVKMGTPFRLSSR